MLALTQADFDFTKKTVSINKSYQRINGRDVITDPKTPKSNRIIKLPDFLAEEMQDYISHIYGVQPYDRLFPITKSYLHNEMTRFPSVQSEMANDLNNFKMGDDEDVSEES